jgi:hypothetical protein
MPLDSGQATSKMFIFAEIKKEYLKDPAQKAFDWQEKNFSFSSPDASFLKGVEPFEKVIEVDLRSTGGGFYDVYLKRTDGNPLNYSASVGHIKRGA